MSTRTSDYLVAVKHLPADGTMILPRVSWMEFESLAAALGDRRDVRLSYNQGRLEITMPSPEHEEYVDLIQDLTRSLVRELGLRLESRGTVLLKREFQETGAQPDGCFYIQNAEKIIGKRTLDLSTDPPPDIVVEVDLSIQSLTKFPIYAALSVPEIWRYDGEFFEIHQLDGEEYVEAPASIAFPFLTADVMAEMIEQSKLTGQDEALDHFVRWVQRHKP
ncbi:MAG: Uma2 family endonuclease [Blastocatellia bacterium]